MTASEMLAVFLSADVRLRKLLCGWIDSWPGFSNLHPEQSRHQMKPFASPSVLWAAGRLASGKAFTIIELLIVIALIFLLAALLLPALASGKSQARSTYCLNDMRQLSIALHG